MKKLIAATLAMSLLGGTLAMAQTSGNAGSGAVPPTGTQQDKSEQLKSGGSGQGQ